MGKIKKLLYVTNDTNFFINHFLPIAKGAQFNSYLVHVASPPIGDVATIIKEGLNFHPYPIRRGEIHLWHELQTIQALYKLYLSLKPDLVHHLTFKPVLFGGLVARLTRIPVNVNILPGLGYTFIAKGMKATLIRLVILKGLKTALRHRNLRVIFQNPDDMSLLVNSGIVRRKDSLLIRAVGVDMNLFQPKQETGGIPLVVLASRMLWDKGIREFVEAAEQLRASGVKAKFVLVGESDFKNPSAIPISQLKSWHNSGAIEWWGYREDMPHVLQQAHIVCLPSYREGLPKVLIEAAACGRPIVTSDAPGCREIVVHGENGLLVPVRDSKALADALRHLIEDGDLRQQMGAKGREIALTEFSVEKVVHDTLAIYRELLNSH